MKKHVLLPVILLLVLILTACSTGSTGNDPFAGLKLATLSGNSGKSTAQPYSDGTTSGATLASEDFSSDNGKWATQDDEYGKAAFENGTFVVTARQEAKTMWSTYNETFTNVKIEVDATVLNATENDNNGFGVDCRVQENGDGYSFQISSDGYYAIVKFADTDGSELIDWTESDAINQGEGTNHITAICQGNNLELWVNNVFLASATDDAFASGNVSLSATTFTSTNTEVAFDNFQIVNPQ
ncbi:MAG: family 16 glycoside hydrolase [Anaerolineaceae bacterium]|nr:family 16 glycoside hydrolase [Anaerolineaceae bacterium]